MASAIPETPTEICNTAHCITNDHDTHQMMAAEYQVIGLRRYAAADVEYAQSKLIPQHASRSILRGSLQEGKDVAQTSRCGCIVDRCS